MVDTMEETDHNRRQKVTARAVDKKYIQMTKIKIQTKCRFSTLSEIIN